MIGVNFCGKYDARHLLPAAVIFTQMFSYKRTYISHQRWLPGRMSVRTYRLSIRLAVQNAIDRHMIGISTGHNSVN